MWPCPSLSGLPHNKLNAEQNLFLRGTSSGWNQVLDFSLSPAWDSSGNSSFLGGPLFQKSERQNKGHTCLFKISSLLPGQLKLNLVMESVLHCGFSAPGFCSRAPRLTRILPLPPTTPWFQKGSSDQGPSFLIYKTEIQTRSLSWPVRTQKLQKAKLSLQPRVWAGKCRLLQGSPW